ncbi:uncharacterized protein LOC123551920 [Mercenaria mercenaria]|uniref:uncharacterized protein LOC123551920 n=1 Tax=Mercenaria mercenaria TaxID=6596 RepID=UPI00234F1A0A|nr:uncharacterized protein LOC123551920 [Mercenaria mercenaria]
MIQVVPHEQIYNNKKGSCNGLKMTDILKHTVHFSNNVIIPENTMEHGIDISNDLKRKNESATGQDVETSGDLSEKINNGSDDPKTTAMDVESKNDGKIEEFIDDNEKIQSIVAVAIKGEVDEKESPERNSLLLIPETREMSADGAAVNDDKVEIESGVNDMCTAEKAENIKTFEDIKHEMDQKYLEEESVKAKELKQIENNPGKYMNKTLLRSKLNGSIDVESVEASEQVISNETDKYDRNFKSDLDGRKMENLRRGKFPPLKCEVDKNLDLSEDEMCFTEDSDDDRDFSEFDKLYLKNISGKNIKENGKDLLKFAEVLYKCTLCTSIPSILTSEDSFIKHVNRQHLSEDSHCHTCKMCSLKVRTEEDLKEHVIYSHTGSDENLSCDFTGSDITGSHDQMIDSNNDSDSDSSGHRQLRAKVIKRSKPVQDFESPKQLVDHTGIETLNGSLDLTQKHFYENREPDKVKKNKTNKDSSVIDIKQITDQIIKSDVQGRNVSNGNLAKLPFNPSFTAEFGKYTKLVREGGNIVYFCQICNWKSPIKTTFQVHCNMSAHKNKVLSAENPEDNHDSNSKSPKCCEKNLSPNLKTENSKDNGKRPYSAQDISVGPRMPDQNLFYNFIMRPKAVTQCRGRTPIVSPYGTSSFIEDARFTYKRPNEHPVDLAMKKRKRLLKHSKFGRNSDSDSDDSRDNKICLSTKSSHSSNMTLLRQKLLEGRCGNKQSNKGKERQIVCENSNFPADLSNGSNPKRSEYCSKTLELTSFKKEKLDYVGTDGVNWNKRQNYPEMDGNHSNRFVEKDGISYLSESRYRTKIKDEVKMSDSLLTQYKCHACSFRYSEVDEYERHFDKVHKSSVGNLLSHGSRGPMWPQGLDDSGSGSRFGMDSGIGAEGKGEPFGGRNVDQTVSGSCEMGENWRVQKLKEVLPDYVVECDRGNTSRDYLLQCISSSSGIQDAVLWSSACNRAMRELYPNSQAQRKGKYKKTYYFGISMLDAYQIQEELPGTEGESPLYQPHRDINIDMEKIVEHLPSILKWTGNMDSGVHRQDLLLLLCDVIQDSDVSNWGAQCNRAIRLVFPNIDMKRKGKYKTTMYQGVEFQKDVLKRLAKYNNHFVDLQNADLSNRKSPVNNPVESNFIPKEHKRGKTLERLLTRDSNSPEIVPHFEQIDTKNRSPVLTYPQWMKKEDQIEMGQYLAKFGGVSMFETQNGSPGLDECNDVCDKVTFNQGDDKSGVNVPVDQGDKKSDTDVAVDHGDDKCGINVPVDQGDDNDGDDEEESLDSVQIQ